MEIISLDCESNSHGLLKPAGSPHHPMYDARAAERAFRHLIDARGKAQR